MRTTLSRFNVGDSVQIISFRKLPFQERVGIVEVCKKSPYAHTLDKYKVRIQNYPELQTFFDIELQKIEPEIQYQAATKH